MVTLESEADPASQRAEILNKIKQQKIAAVKDFNDKKTKQQINLVRGILRVVLMSLIYAWGFYGIATL